MLTAAAAGTALSPPGREKERSYPSSPAGGLAEEREVEGRRWVSWVGGRERDDSWVRISDLCNR